MGGDSDNGAPTLWTKERKIKREGPKRSGASGGRIRLAWVRGICVQMKERSKSKTTCFVEILDLNNHRALQLRL